MAGKLEYIVDIVANDKPLRESLSRLDWNKIIGNKNFSKVLQNESREAVDTIKSTLGGINWAELLGEKDLQRLETVVAKVITQNRKKLEALNPDDVTGIQNIVDYVSELGKELNSLGSGMNVSSLVRNMGAFMKVLEPISKRIEDLSKEPDKVTAAFDRMFASINAAANSTVSGGKNTISREFQSISSEADKYLNKLQESQDQLNKILSQTFEFKPKKTLKAQESELNRYLEQYKVAEKKLNDIAGNADLDELDYNMQLAEQYNEIVVLLEKIRVTKDAIGNKSKTDNIIGFDLDKVIKKTLQGAQGSYDEAIRYIKEEYISDSPIIQAGASVVVDVRVPTESEVKAKINDIIDSINKKGSLHSIKLDIDDEPNFIEDKSRRQYGNKPASNDANTDDLVEKTEQRLQRIEDTFDKKLNGKIKENGEVVAEGILQKTQKWREEMIKAMTISAKDLEFEFGWQNSAVTGAGYLKDELQNYFNNNPIDVRINPETLAKQITSIVEANGITIGGSGGAANIDAKSLASAVYAGVQAAFYGGTGFTSEIDTNIFSESMSSFEKSTENVSDETEEATEANYEYIKSLSESTTGVGTLIETLKELAKLSNKAKPPQAVKDLAELLSIKVRDKDGKVKTAGIDLAKINDDTSPSEIAQMIQDSLFAKDSTGMARGTDLADTIRRKLAKMPNGNTKILSEILANNVEDLLKLQDVSSEFESERDKRIGNVSAFKELLPTLKLLDYLGTVRGTKKYKTNPTVAQIDEAMKFFEGQERSTKQFEELLKAREKFDKNPTEEARKEFEAAQNTFYKNTTLLFNELNEKSLGFKGEVYLKDGKGNRTFNSSGAYPRGIRFISENDVQDVVFYGNTAKNIDVGYTGSTQKHPKENKRRAANIASRITYSDRPTYQSSRVKPKIDARYDDISYEPFKIREKTPNNNEIGRLPNLADASKSIPELEEKLNTLDARIAELQEINAQLSNDVEDMSVGRKKTVDLSKLNAVDRYTKNLSSALTLLDGTIDNETIAILDGLNISEIKPKALVDIVSKLTEIQKFDSQISTINAAGGIQNLVSGARKRASGGEALAQIQNLQGIDFKKNIPFVDNIDALINILPNIDEDTNIFQELYDEIGKALNPSKFNELIAKRNELNTTNDPSEWVKVKNEINKITNDIFNGYRYLTNQRDTLSSSLLTLDKNSPEYSEASLKLADIDKKLSPILKQLKPIFGDKQPAISTIFERLNSLYGNVNASIERAIENQFKNVSLDELIKKKEEANSSIKNIISQLKNIVAKTLGNKTEEQTREVQTLVSQIQKIREALYKEAEEYIKILANKNLDANTRNVTTAKLQQVLTNIYGINSSASQLQAFTDIDLLDKNKTTSKVDAWAKENYNLDYRKQLVSQINILREEKDNEEKYVNLVAKEKQLKEEIVALTGKENKNKKVGKTQELQIVRDSLKEIRNKRSKKHRSVEEIKSDLESKNAELASFDSKNVAANITNQAVRNERELNQAFEEQKKIKSQLADANNFKREHDRIQFELEFTTKYTSLLEQEKKLLEEINQLKRDGLSKNADKIGTKNTKLLNVQEQIKELLDNTLTPERAQTARQQALNYNDKLTTIELRRRKFNRELKQIEADEQEFNKYGLTAGAGLSEYNDYKYQLRRNFIQSEEYKNIRNQKIEHIKKIIPQDRELTDKEKAMQKELYDNLDKEMNKLAQDYIDSFKIDENGRLISSRKRFKFDELVTEEDGKVWKIDAFNNWKDDNSWEDFTEVIDENIRKTIQDRLRLAERKAIAEEGLKPLDATKTDIEEQKRLALRYGGLEEKDLVNSKFFDEIDRKRADLIALEDKLTKLLSEKIDIENSNMDEDVKNKDLAKKNKKIKEAKLKIQNLERSITDYKNKIKEDNAARSEGIPDSQKLEWAQKKLERYNRSLERTEEKLKK